MSRPARYRKAPAAGKTNAASTPSSMTLFSFVAPNERLWHEAFEAFFASEADPRTLELLSESRTA
jgi:uncharacterized protein (DUF1810 family)